MRGGGDWIRRATKRGRSARARISAGAWRTRGRALSGTARCWCHAIRRRVARCWVARCRVARCRVARCRVARYRVARRRGRGGAADRQTGRWRHHVWQRGRREHARDGFLAGDVAAHEVRQASDRPRRTALEGVTRGLCAPCTPRAGARTQAATHLGKRVRSPDVRARRKRAACGLEGSAARTDLGGLCGHRDVPRGVVGCAFGTRGVGGCRGRGRRRGWRQCRCSRRCLSFGSGRRRCLVPLDGSRFCPTRCRCGLLNDGATTGRCT